MMPRRAVTAVVFVACGGAVSDVDGGGTDGNSLDSSLADGDGGWTTCSSPSGQRVCDGPNNCGGLSDTCGCITTGKDSPTAVHACGNSPGFGQGFACYGAPDGFICIDPDDAPPPLWWPVEYDMGVLFANNGGADRVRYADLGLWTGAPIPNPPNCPTLKWAQVCGGNCGGCPDTATCHGRSPLHPYGFCEPNLINDSCDLSKGTLCASSANKCFTYAVEPTAQDVANANSFCLPANMCDDLAANLPGGGVCQ